MTQGFKMRSQPLFICPALWPRYRCGEKKTAILSNVQSSVGTWRKFSSTYTGDQFQQEKLHIQCLKGRWGRWSEGGGGVIALTTKNHMHIHFCASDYEWAAGHWLTLIIALFSLSFYEWQSSKGKKKKKGLCHGSWLSHKALGYSCPLQTIPLENPSSECSKSKLVLANNLSVAQFWLWVKKGGGRWVKQEGNIRLLDPLFWILRSHTVC